MNKKIAVIGLGYVGLPLALSASNSGYKVVGIDNNVNKVNVLKAGRNSIEDIENFAVLNSINKGNLLISDDFSEISGSEVILICVPTPLNNYFKPDLSHIELAANSLSPYIQPGTLIILESTVEPSTTRNFLRPILEQGSGLTSDQFFVAFSPERIDPSNHLWHIKNTPKLVAGLTDVACTLAMQFYGNFIDELVQCQSLEIAETAKLLENSFRLVNISFINEFSIFCQKLGIDVNEVIKAAATKPYGFMPFYPGIGVGGHCIPIDPSYLTYSAKEADTDAPLVNIANKINFSNPIKIAKRIKVKLGGNLRDKEIQIAGITYKPNISDLRESPALVLIKELKNLGAKVSWFDPFVKVYDGEESQPLKSSVDLGLIVTPHDVIDFSIWKTFNINVLDLSSTSKNYGWPKFL